MGNHLQNNYWNKDIQYNQNNANNNPATVIINMPKPKPPPIYKKGQEFPMFAKRFNDYLDAIKLPETERKAFLLQNIDNPTYSTIDNMLLSPNLNYNNWIKAITERLGEKLGPLGNNLKILNIKQSENQSIVEYIEDLNEIIKKTNYNEEQAAEKQQQDADRKQREAERRGTGFKIT